MLKLTRRKFGAYGFTDEPFWIAPGAIVTLSNTADGAMVYCSVGGFEVAEKAEAILAMIDNARNADNLEMHERVMEAMALLEAEDDEDGATRQ